MKNLKKFAALAVVVPFSLALVACGNGGSTPESTTGGGGGEGSLSGELTVWCWDPAFNIYAMNEAAKIYNEKNPDAVINVVETPWDDLQTKLTTLAQSGATEELPDIFLMQNNAFQKNVINYPDLFSALTDSGIAFNEFPEGVRAYSTVEGVNYGLPFDNGTAITALRTDILEEAGYTIDDFTDVTWSDFITKGKDVLAKTGKPMLSGTTGSSDMIMIMLQSAGGGLFDADGNGYIAGNDTLLAAIETYAELVKSGVYLEVNSWDEYIGSFVNGNVAGTINGVWIMGSIQTAEDQAGNWAVTNLPKIDGVDGATHYSANGGSSWAISSNANFALAADFLANTFGGSAELFDTILPSAGAVSTWLPAAESDVYAKPLDFFGGQAVFADVLAFSKSVPQAVTGVYYYEANDAVSAAITKIINGADPVAALEEAQGTLDFAMN